MTYTTNNDDTQGIMMTYTTTNDGDIGETGGNCNIFHIGAYMIITSSMYFTNYVCAVAYPEVVSGGGSKSRKFKWLVKVGVSKGVTPCLKNHGLGGGGFRATRKPPWIRHCCVPHSPATHVV